MLSKIVSICDSALESSLVQCLSDWINDFSLPCTKFKEIFFSYQLKTSALSIIYTITYNRCSVRHSRIYLHCVTPHYASAHFYCLRHTVMQKKDGGSSRGKCFIRDKAIQILCITYMCTETYNINTVSSFHSCSSPISETTDSESWPNETFIILSFLLILLLKLFKFYYHYPQETCLLALGEGTGQLPEPWSCWDYYTAS